MNLLLLQLEDFVAEPLSAGQGLTGQVRICGERANHLATVLQVSPGSTVRVGLLNSLVGTGTVVTREERVYRLDVVLDHSPPPPSPVRLILALPRPKVLGRVLKTVTALGVKELTLVDARRVEKSYWQNHRVKPEVLAGLCRQGLEQARDTVMPQVRLRRRLSPFILEELPDVAAGSERLIAHPGGAELGRERLAGSPQPITLAIGPEGGWLPLEVEQFARQGFLSVGLGERVLHIEAVLPWILGRLEGRLNADTV